MAFIGNSKAIGEIRERIFKIALSDFTVMLYGETGSGKGVVAEEIHKASARKQQPFITVNCTAIPETLLESELFGAEKGSYTGSVSRRIGLFDQANNGTIFLDEIGDLSLYAQVKLLRAIQEKKIRRLGGEKEFDIDVRIIAATHRNLAKSISEGKFREDLFYRLNVLTLTIPPLREHKEDIEDLIKYYLQKNSFKQCTIDTDAIAFLKELSWGGNVRELENVILKLIIESQDNNITLNLTNDVLRKAAFHTMNAAEIDIDEMIKSYLYSLLTKVESGSEKNLYDPFQKLFFQNVIQMAKGNVAKASQLIGFSRPGFRSKIREYNLQGILERERD